jgi:hypothetical protein
MEKQFLIHKERDFSGVFSDGVNFLKVHFKHILKSFVFIVVPVYTIATVMVSILSSKFIDLFTYQARYNSYNAPTPFDDPFTILGFFGVYLLYGIALLLSVATIYSYIKVYNEKATDETITPNEVWKVTGRAALKLFGYGFLYMIIFAIPIWLVFFLFGLIMGVLMLVPVIGFIIIFLGIVFLSLLVFAYINVLTPVIVYEKAGIFGSLSRAAALLRGNFWQTVGITLVSAMLVQFIFYGVYMLFFVLINGLGIFSASPDIGLLKIIIIVFAIVGPLILFLGYVFQYSISGFLYYSLLEKLDHVGLNMKIENMNEDDSEKPAEEY